MKQVFRLFVATALLSTFLTAPLFAQTYSFSSSSMCVSAQQTPPFDCQYPAYSNVFRLSESVYSWIRFYDAEPEDFVVRHEWYSSANPGVLLWSYEATRPCCGDITSSSLRQASMLGAGDYFVKFFVRLVSNPNFVEVEQQSFQIYPNTCSAPIGLTATGIGHTWIAVEWTDPVEQECGDDYKLEYRQVGTTAWSSYLPGGGSCPPYVIPLPSICPTGIPSQTVFGLKPCTNYEFRVSKFCNYTGTVGTYSAPSSTIVVSTGECGNAYFTATPQRYAVGLAECAEIAYVNFAGIGYSNAGDCNGSNSGYLGYEYYQTESATVKQGSAYSIDLGIRTHEYPDHYIGAWIDYDQNGTFDAGEKVITENNLMIDYCESTDLGYTISIPANAKIGQTRMRIIAQLVSVPQPHAGPLAQSGSVADFNVIVQPGGANACLPVPSLSTNLIAHYPLDGTPNDAAGSNNGTAFGGLLYTTDRTGTASKAANFDGLNDSITTANAIAERSVAFWFRANAAAQMPIFQGGSMNNQTGAGYFIGTYQPGGVPAVTWDTTYGVVVDFVNRGVYIPFQNIVTGWHHIAVSWDGISPNIKVAIDGEPLPGYLYNTSTGGFAANLSSQPFSMGSAPSPNAAAKTRFGVNYATRLWNIGLDKMNGRLDEVRIYARALTDDEMRLLAEVYATASPAVVCSAQTVTLTSPIASATSYAWKNLTTGASIGTTQTVMPSVSATTSFALEAVLPGCTFRDTVKVTRPPSIIINNLTANNLTGSFTLSGGLPQTNGSNYASVTMALQGSPAVTATLTTAPFTHNETVSFTCPQAGTYTVVATDAGGCSGTGTVVVTGGGGTGNGPGLPAGDCWTWQNPLPQGNWLNDVFFVDGQIGSAVGASGTILKTNNGGAIWSQQIAGTSNSLNAVHFTDSQNGWVVGNAGIILKTNNEGSTWTMQNSGTSTSLNAVHFTDAQKGWVVGESGTILKTSNGGMTWTAQTAGINNNLYSVQLTDAQTGWAVGESGTILKTINGGETWTVQSSGTGNWLYSVHFTDSQTGWTVGVGGTILKTSNGGADWTAQNSGTSNRLSAVHFTSTQSGWAVGDYGILGIQRFARKLNFA